VLQYHLETVQGRFDDSGVQVDYRDLYSSTFGVVGTVMGGNLAVSFSFVIHPTIGVGVGVGVEMAIFTVVKHPGAKCPRVCDTS